MSKKKNKPKKENRNDKKWNIDPKKLKSFGITKDIRIEIDEVERIKGDEINGGRDTTPPNPPTTTDVCQQWPTGG